MDAKTFYMLVVLLLCCCEKDSLTKQKARTRWERLRNAALLSLPGGVVGLLVGFSRIESIKQRLMIFVAWNPDVVGISTMRWLMGQTVAVEDVLKEAERHFPRAKEFYKIKCRHEIKNKNE
jgi:uncharacterized membrane protein YsdA (DUF1294 family)